MCELHKLDKITENTMCDIGLRFIFMTGKSMFEMQYMEKKEQFCNDSMMEIAFLHDLHAACGMTDRS